jgi:acetylornithine deacetylase/succinyl-diaminopimelate desuccinylase-like protein
MGGGLLRRIRPALSYLVATVVVGLLVAVVTVAQMAFLSEVADLGLTLEEGVAGGASDGNTTSLYTATLDGLGGVGDGAHARHEFVFADRMVERCALLTLLLLEPPLGEGSA